MKIKVFGGVGLKNKIIVAIALLAVLVIGFLYFRPLKVNYMIEPYSSGQSPIKLDTSIFFSALSDKDLSVKGEASIKELMSIIENIKIRKLLTVPGRYSPSFKSTYQLWLYYPNNTVLSIHIINHDYIEIGRKVYKITEAEQLSKIYDLIILDQDKGTIDKFYYDFVSEDSP